MSVLCFLAAFLPLSANAQVVARVNGEPIFQHQLEAQKSHNRARGSEVDDQKVLEHLILYRLALQEAEKHGLQKEPAVERKMEKVLYQAFLDKSLKGASVQPTSDRELKQLYQKWPWVRLRHLVLMARTPEEETKAKETLKVVTKKIEAQTPFEKLVLKYSEDPQAKTSGGDLDYVGHQSLAPEFYQAIAALKAGEVSQPLKFQGAIHLFQVTDRKPFREAPASYRHYLAEFARREKENRYLTQLFENLKSTATIITPSRTKGTSE